MRFLRVGAFNSALACRFYTSFSFTCAVVVDAFCGCKGGECNAEVARTLGLVFSLGNDENGMIAFLIGFEFLFFISLRRFARLLI